MSIPCTSRQFFALLLLGLAALGASRGHADQLDDIMAAAKLRVAIDLAVPPYGMKDERLQTTGSDVETAQLLAKDLGLALEIVPTTGANRIPFLQTGKADIVISSLSVTPQRQEVIDFSTPYAAILAVIAAPRGLKIAGPADLAGRKIASTRGTTNDQELTKIAPPTARIIRFDDDATSITAVVSGQADIFATAPPLLKSINDRNPSRQMEPKFTMKVNMLAVGLRKGETRLQAKVDEAIKARLKSGELNAIYRRFHGADLPAELMVGGN